MKNLHRYSAALFGFASISFAAQAEIVNGVVLDDLGETVIGATIMEKGTTNGTITDFDGNFTIDVNSDVIVVSYVGM